MEWERTVLFWPVYMAPFIVGCFRRSPGRVKLFFFNFFLGWTFVGWFFAWTFVFPDAFGRVLAPIVMRLAGGGGSRPAAAAPDPFAPAEAAPRPCATCGRSGKVRCSTCQGRGSWYEQPQTAHGTAQLAHCTACASSGSITCPSCGGSGQSW